MNVRRQKQANVLLEKGYKELLTNAIKILNYLDTKLTSKIFAGFHML